MFAMFGFMRQAQGSYYTLRRFKWFFFFSLLMMWVYNDAILFRTFGMMAAYFMVFIFVGGDAEEVLAAAGEHDETDEELPDDS